MKNKTTLLALCLLIVLAGISLFVGVSSINLGGLLAGDEAQMRIFMVSRVPRLLAILLAGSAMSVVGLIMQQLAQNKFVAPSTAGTVESASFGILIALLFFGSASVMQKLLIGFAFALLGTVIFMQILVRIQFKNAIFVPLVGIMFGGVVAAITTFFAYQFELLQSLQGWTNGDFSGILRGRYELLYIALPATIIAYIFADRFTLAGMGESFAVNLGLNYKQVLYLGLGIVALVTSVVVLTVGTIPFLGLIVPNIATMMMGDNVRRTLPLTALLGMIFVLACDIVGRTIRYPYEIPIGTIVGIVGTVLFLFLIFRQEGRHATA